MTAALTWGEVGIVAVLCIAAAFLAVVVYVVAGARWDKRRVTALEACGCYRCLSELDELDPPAFAIFGRTNMQMVVCERCGNKRCPHSTDHRLDCTRSNEPGQVGSRYA